MSQTSPSGTRKLRRLAARRPAVPATVEPGDFAEAAAVTASASTAKKRRVATSKCILSDAVAEVISKSLAPLATIPPGLTRPNPLYDLISHCHRGVDREVIVSKFSACWDVSPLEAMQALYFIRDSRGKEGERQVFYYLATWLRQHHPQTYIINLMSMIGYFKDLLHLAVLAEQGKLPTLGTKDFLELEIFAAQLRSDSESSEISLAAKWAPSEKLAFDKQYRLATRIAKLLFKQDIHAQYRKLLTRLRARLDVVEVKMCAGRWSDINYDEVPAAAHSTYGSSFAAHDKERYLSSREKYISEGNKGDEILSPYFKGGCVDDTVEDGWREFVKRVKEEVGDLSIVAVIDSEMTDLYRQSSISLALLALHLSPTRRSNEVHAAPRNDTLVFEKVGNLMRLSGSSWAEVEKLFDSRETDNSIVIFFTCKEVQASSKHNVVVWNVARDSSSVSTDRHGNIVLSGNSPKLLRYCRQGVSFEQVLAAYDAKVHDDDEDITMKTKPRNS